MVGCVEKLYSWMVEADTCCGGSTRKEGQLVFHKFTLTGGAQQGSGGSSEE